MTIKGEAEWKQWTKRSKGSKVNKTRKEEIKKGRPWSITERRLSRKRDTEVFAALRRLCDKGQRGCCNYNWDSMRWKPSGVTPKNRKWRTRFNLSTRNLHYFIHPSLSLTFTFAITFSFGGLGCGSGGSMRVRSRFYFSPASGPSACRTSPTSWKLLENSIHSNF